MVTYGRGQGARTYEKHGVMTNLLLVAPLVLLRLLPWVFGHLW